MHVHTHTFTQPSMYTVYIYVCVCVCTYTYTCIQNTNTCSYTYINTHIIKIYTNTLSTCVHIYSQATLSRTLCNYIAIHIKTSIIMLPVQLDFLNTLVYPKTNKSHRGMLPITETLVLQTRSQNQYHNGSLF